MPYVEREIIVQAPSDSVYQAWRNFEQFPGFMKNIEEVRIDGLHSHWRAKGPLGATAEWDAVITVDEPGRAIAWHSVDTDGASVSTSGSVEFVSEGDSTRVCLRMDYEPQAGALGDIAARVFADPEAQIDEDLARFKDGMERGGQFHRVTSGEVAGANTSEHLSQSVGRRPLNRYEGEPPRGPGMPQEQVESAPPTSA